MSHAQPPGMLGQPPPPTSGQAPPMSHAQPPGMLGQPPPPTSGQALPMSYAHQASRNVRTTSATNFRTGSAYELRPASRNVRTTSISRTSYAPSTRNASRTPQLRTNLWTPNASYGDARRTPSNRPPVYVRGSCSSSGSPNGPPTRESWGTHGCAPRGNAAAASKDSD
jgi:hypothetical protein